MLAHSKRPGVCHLQRGNGSIQWLSLIGSCRCSSTSWRQISPPATVFCIRALTARLRLQLSCRRMPHSGAPHGCKFAVATRSLTALAVPKDSAALNLLSWLWATSQAANLHHQDTSRSSGAEHIGRPAFDGRASVCTITSRCCRPFTAWSEFGIAHRESAACCCTIKAGCFIDCSVRSSLLRHAADLGLASILCFCPCRVDHRPGIAQGC